MLTAGKAVTTVPAALAMLLRGLLRYQGLHQALLATGTYAEASVVHCVLPHPDPPAEANAGQQ
jgi:hypothetical protein